MGGGGGVSAGAQEADSFPSLSFFPVQRGANASSPTPGRARSASRPELNAAGAKTLYVNRRSQPRLSAARCWFDVVSRSD